MKAYKSSAVQPQMFQFVDMDELVPKKHILRQINETLDLSIVHDWVAPLYTERTVRSAADPERMVRLMLFSLSSSESEVSSLGCPSTKLIAVSRIRMPACIKRATARKRICGIWCIM